MYPQPGWMYENEKRAIHDQLSIVLKSHFSGNSTFKGHILSLIREYKRMCGTHATRKIIEKHKHRAAGH